MDHILRQYGAPLVFLAVLLESLGLPMPSYPLILVASALAEPLHFQRSAILLGCVLAAMAGDGVWYRLGRARGRPVLRWLCSLSLSPDSCVQSTERTFARYGTKSLLIAKFIPGLSTVAPSLAGMLKVRHWRFIGFDMLGVTLWAGSAMVVGWAFRTEVEWAMAWLMAFGSTGVLILAVALAGWLLIKWVERHQFFRLLERSRITAIDLKERLDRGDDIVIVDLRSDLGYHGDGAKVAGAIWIPPHEFEKRYSEIPTGRTVVMYCT